MADNKSGQNQPKSFHPHWSAKDSQAQHSATAPNHSEKPLQTDDPFNSVIQQILIEQQKKQEKLNPQKPRKTMINLNTKQAFRAIFYMGLILGSIYIYKIQNEYKKKYATTFQTNAPSESTFKLVAKLLRHQEQEAQINSQSYLLGKSGPQKIPPISQVERQLVDPQNPYQALLTCTTQAPWSRYRTPWFRKLNDQLAIFYWQRYAYVYTYSSAIKQKVFSGILWQNALNKLFKKWGKNLNSQLWPSKRLDITQSFDLESISIPTVVRIKLTQSQYLHSSPVMELLSESSGTTSSSNTPVIINLNKNTSTAKPQSIDPKALQMLIFELTAQYHQYTQLGQKPYFLPSEHPEAINETTVRRTLQACQLAAQTYKLDHLNLYVQKVLTTPGAIHAMIKKASYLKPLNVEASKGTSVILNSFLFMNNQAGFDDCFYRHQSRSSITNLKLVFNKSGQVEIVSFEPLEKKWAPYAIKDRALQSCLINEGQKLIFAPPYSQPAGFIKVLMLYRRSTE